MAGGARVGVGVRRVIGDLDGKVGVWEAAGGAQGRGAGVECAVLGMTFGKSGFCKFT